MWRVWGHLKWQRGICNLSKRSKLWCVGILLCLAALVLAALILPQSFRLNAFSDVIQCFLLASGTLCFLPNILRSRGRIRLFWTIMSLGIGLWFVYQLLWTYYEVVLRRDVPDLFAGDIILFLHIVPLMAALGLRPHVARDEATARTGRLDFTLLMVWWVYIYVLIVMAWQYAVPDDLQYSHNLNSVYLAEKIVFLSALAVCWATSQRPWKTFYGNLFIASVIYAASSYVANWAITRDVYYSGSLYDIPLAVSMAGITYAGLQAGNLEGPRETTTSRSPVYGVWVARCGMIATFSLPVFAAWAILDTALPSRIRFFRLVLTFAAALVLGVMVFMRQYLLDRELLRLLNHSRESFENLKRLQAQIVQSEKMASIGQLLGGAAHELNNPITAMLGYADLLSSTTLSAGQHTLVAKIGQHVRRTRSQVAGLLSFARQAPAAKASLDLNMLARTAVHLTQPQAQALKIEVRSDFSPNLPKVLGDSNQLLQVCVQIVGNALDGMDENSGHTLLVSTRAQNGSVIFKVWKSNLSGVAVSSAEYGDALGLSACQGIVQEHRGRIICADAVDGGTVIEVELPTAGLTTQSTISPAPLLAQSQPYA